MTREEEVRDLLGIYDKLPPDEPLQAATVGHLRYLLEKVERLDNAIYQHKTDCFIPSRRDFALWNATIDAGLPEAFKQELIAGVSSIQAEASP